MEVYNTLGRRRVEFVSREAGRVGIYVCGPTVQAAPHLGHGRAGVVFDVVRFVPVTASPAAETVTVEPEVVQAPVAIPEAVPVPTAGSRASTAAQRACEQTRPAVSSNATAEREGESWQPSVQSAWWNRATYRTA